MPSIQLSNVSIDFPLYHASSRSIRRMLLQAAFGRPLLIERGRASVRALDGIDLIVREGDRIALIGPNGAGKTTLLRVMAGVFAPTAGYVVRSGQVRSLLSVGMGLDMESSGRDNIRLLGMHLDMAPAAIRALVDEIIDWTELGAFIEAPLRTYSAGMIMRLAFAVSTALPPEILLLDEWLGVGDAQFQRKAQERMAQFVNRASILVLASHSPHLLSQWCTRGIRLEAGRISGEGEVEEMLKVAGLDG